MARKRKVIVDVATSADGYIARPDGDVEWLNRRPHKNDYGMNQFYSSSDFTEIRRSKTALFG